MATTYCVGEDGFGVDFRQSRKWEEEEGTYEEEIVKCGQTGQNRCKVTFKLHLSSERKKKPLLMAPLKWDICFINPLSWKDKWINIKNGFPYMWLGAIWGKVLNPSHVAAIDKLFMLSREERNNLVGPLILCVRLFLLNIL